MYVIKHIPEDFIVKEINELHFDGNGKYSYFLLKKKKYNTLRAVERIAEFHRIPLKDIGFAGNKDKNAVTEQFISIKNGKKDFECTPINDIELKFLGRGNEELFLGRLQGNQFNITIRNLNSKDIEKIKKSTKDNCLMPNFFGPQRFSKNNHLIGKAIIKNEFKHAIDFILDSNSDYNEMIKDHLASRNNEYVGAMKKVPMKMLRLYIHAYQSFLFNTILEKYAKKNSQKIEIPVPGFGTEFENKEVKKMTETALKAEKVTLRDFIIRPIPDLSMEGSMRKAFVAVNDFSIIEETDDEYFNKKRKIVVSFSLPGGSYATVLISFLFGEKINKKIV